ncbi:hypothetical protein RI129_005532 [Pyrocoelia pectoralis]|uniref:CCHC-type domain-containing protein n=1 Tax=Pyrocoelia pectoralis TaxID=417401 RepID=A0AAN7VKD3_9COLE
MEGGSFPRTGATRENACEEGFPPLKESFGTSEKEDSVPRFLVLKKKEGDFTNISPFLISKMLYGLIGNVKEVKKVKGELLIETVSSKQSRQLIKCERFGGYEIVVVPHGALNMSKGVVYCRDLLNCSIEEIKENLKNQGVVDVRRIRTRRDGELIDTANHILTFNVSKLPRMIQAAFYPLQVRPYIPNPLRCFNCQRFGHSSVNCKHDKRCVCGKPTHEGIWCEEPINCIWDVINDLHNSDHFPIIIKTDLPETEKVTYKRWIVAKADWNSFANNLVTPSPVNVDDITKCIKHAAQT